MNKGFWAVSVTLLSVVVSCEKVVTDETTHYIPASDNDPAIEAIKRRAHQIAEVQWYTLSQVPRNTGFFPANTVIEGIPYSSVKELDKFVGHDVSFYTFLTATQNPKSVLYTEDVGESPYHGVNCAAYYGTVCSMAVNYALGLDAPFESGMYADLPFIEKVEKQDPSSVKVGDILWKKGHVVMVEDVTYHKDNSISSVAILESSGSFTRIKNYSFSSFSKRWRQSSWVLYRYMDFERILKQDDIPFLSSISVDNFSSRTRLVVCPSRGDRACYREGEDVVLNILGPCEGDIIVSQNDQEICRFIRPVDDIVLPSLEAGMYNVVANERLACSFEVVQTDVNASRALSGIVVDFSSSNGLPESVVFCTRTGSRKHIHLITDEERSIGQLSFDTLFSGSYVKVVFRGEYGRVTNNPIYIK